MTEATITIARDGLWPTVWAWRVRAGNEYFRGNAFTKDRASRHAERCAQTALTYRVEA